MTVPFRHQGIAEQRRTTVSRIDAMTVKVTRVSGYVLLLHDPDVSAAETSVDLTFPVVFGEKPVFTYGSELAAGWNPVAGSFPTLSATVAGWTTVGEVLGVTEGRFVAARVVAVSTGDTGQGIWLHYSFEGKAIRNPLNAADTTDDTI